MAREKVKAVYMGRILHSAKLFHTFLMPDGDTSSRSALDREDWKRMKDEGW